MVFHFTPEDYQAMKLDYWAISPSWTPCWEKNCEAIQTPWNKYHLVVKSAYDLSLLVEKKGQKSSICYMPNINSVKKSPVKFDLLLPTLNICSKNPIHRIACVLYDSFAGNSVKFTPRLEMEYPGNSVRFCNHSWK